MKTFLASSTPCSVEMPIGPFTEL